MNSNNSIVVTADWLASRLDDPSIRIFDCRFDLNRPQYGREAYMTSHIKGAQYLDLEQDLSAPVSTHGGRHPLPDPDLFARKIGEFGVDDAVTVVAYDDQNGAFASRLWWIMRYMGHAHVYILDKGYTYWQLRGLPTSREIPNPQAKQFQPRLQKQMVVTMEDVKSKLHAQGTVLLDSREHKRYLGIEEPIDPVAGHIPGAYHSFWKDGIGEDGSWKSALEQKQRFQHIQQADEVIVYCGSGVTACPNIVALIEAGFPNVKLYAGSWSDWCSYPSNPVATGEEKGD
jgi:thiosulfate/3-mercaptopyruvate sulfurtransferase